MKIVSYNVNGIRSALNKGLIDWIKQDDADIYCFQELKANIEDIPTESFADLGYETYWFPAQKKDIVVLASLVNKTDRGNLWLWIATGRC